MNKALESEQAVIRFKYMHTKLKSYIVVNIYYIVGKNKIDKSNETNYVGTAVLYRFLLTTKNFT